MRKIFCLIFCIAILLTACKEPILEERLQGRWLLELDCTEGAIATIAEATGMDLSEYVEQVNMNLTFYFEFSKENTVTLSVADGQIDLQPLIDELCEVMTEETYALQSLQGNSEEETEALFTSSYGFGVMEYYERMLAQTQPICREIPSISGTYLLDGSKLYIAKAGEAYGEACANISIANRRLTIDGVIDDAFLEPLQAYIVQPPWTLMKEG